MRTGATKTICTPWAQMYSTQLPPGQRPCLGGLGFWWDDPLGDFPTTGEQKRVAGNVREWVRENQSALDALVRQNRGSDDANVRQAVSIVQQSISDARIAAILPEGLRGSPPHTDRLSTAISALGGSTAGLFGGMSITPVSDTTRMTPPPMPNFNPFSETTASGAKQKDLPSILDPLKTSKTGDVPAKGSLGWSGMFPDLDALDWLKWIAVGLLALVALKAVDTVLPSK